MGFCAVFICEELEGLEGCTCSSKGQLCVMGLWMSIKRCGVKANAENRKEYSLSELRMCNMDHEL